MEIIVIVLNHEIIAVLTADGVTNIDRTQSEVYSGQLIDVTSLLLAHRINIDKIKDFAGDIISSNKLYN